MQEQLYQLIERCKSELVALSHEIHQNPELGFEEVLASQLICDYLESKGFVVQKSIEELNTAFKATIGHGKTKIAILAEYDALPEIGHGCGHNIISAVACGVAAAFSSVMDQIDGQLIIIGTPAEETGGGKIILLNKGCFDDVDYAMMVHPGSINMVKRGGSALVDVVVTYRGKGAHSSTPEKGINALKALIHTFNALDMLTSEMPKDVNINGYIKEGGTASNIIPDKASAEFCIRAKTMLDLKVAKDKIIQAINASEMLTSAKAEYVFGLPYAERYPNNVMAEHFKKHLEDLNEIVIYPEPYIKLGSSDVGNVSLKIPTIHPYIRIGDDLKSHTTVFTEASISSLSDDMLIKGAKALSALAYEIFSQEALRNEIQKSFLEQVPDYSSFEF